MRRPAAVTVFGALTIVFAGLFVLGTIQNTALLVLAIRSNIPVLKLVRDNPAYITWVTLSVLLWFLSSVVLFVAGIGLLRLKSWARKLSIAYALFTIVFSMIDMTMDFTLLTLPMIEEAQRTQGPSSTGLLAIAAMLMMTGCLGPIYPIVLLIFMTRPSVVATFQWPALPRDAAPEGEHDREDL